MANHVDPTKPAYHVSRIDGIYADLAQHLEEDIDKVDDVQFRALLETSREVILGLQKALRHYSEKAEKAWQK
jgi:hypothetical protein